MKPIYFYLTLAFLSVIFNRTRITIILFFISLILFPIYQGINLIKVSKWLIICAIIILPLTLIIKNNNPKIIENLEERFFETKTRGLEETSAGTRLLAFKIFAKLFPEHPWLGKGKLHSFGAGNSQDIRLLVLLNNRSSQIHVGFLSLLYYYGVLGGGLFIIFVYLLARKLLKNAKIDGYWSPFLIWLMFIVNNFTDVYFYFNMNGILLGLVLSKYYQQKTNIQKQP